MQINTRLFGLKEVDPSKIITFPNGIPGFEKCTRFHLLHEAGENRKVYYLQSVDEPGLSFNLVKASSIGINFEMDLSDPEADLLGAETADEVALLLLVSRSDDPDLLQGEGNIVPHVNCPIVINTRTRIGFQKVLSISDYEININVTLKE